MSDSHSLRKGPTGWDVDFRHDGERIRRKGFPTYKEAKAFSDAVIAGYPPVKRQSVIQSVDEYLSWSTNVKRKSQNTLRSDTQRLGIFKEWAVSAKLRNISDISVGTVRAFQSYYFENAPFVRNPYHRTTKPNKAATWEKYRQVLSAFCNWCVDRNLMAANPLSRASEFKVPSHHKKPQTFTQSELRKIIDYFDGLGSPQISAFFRLLTYTGCRLSEAINLKWEHVNLETNETVFEETKNYEARSVPILPQLRKALMKLPNSHLYVFDNGHDAHLYDSTWYWKLLRQATEACKLRQRPIHAFRHTFCSTLAELNTNLVTIKELAGHKRIETTMRYIQFTQNAKREAMLRLPF